MFADATEMFNVIAITKQELFAKLAVYIVSFFFVLYHSLLTVITIVLPLTKGTEVLLAGDLAILIQNGVN